MRELSLVLVPLFLLACGGEPLASRTDATPSFAVSGGAEISTYRVDVPLDIVISPTDFPCMTEPIHVYGTFEEHAVLVADGSGGVHLTLHQTTTDLTAIGLTTGVQYRYNGPFTVEFTSPRLAPDAVEITFHNINHFVGPAGAQDVYFRTLIHVTLDPKTGVTKVEVVKDDVLCH